MIILIHLRYNNNSLGIVSLTDNTMEKKTKRCSCSSVDNLLVVINTCENYFKYNRFSLLKQIKESKLSNVI